MKESKNEGLGANERQTRANVDPSEKVSLCSCVSMESNVLGFQRLENGVKERERERYTAQVADLPSLSLPLYLSLPPSRSFARSLARSVETSIPIFRGDGRRMSTSSALLFIRECHEMCIALFFFSLLFLFFPPLSGKHLRTWPVCRAARKPARKISGQRRNASSPD